MHFLVKNTLKNNCYHTPNTSQGSKPSNVQAIFQSLDAGAFVFSKPPFLLIILLKNRTKLYLNKIIDMILKNYQVMSLFVFKKIIAFMVILATIYE